MYHIQHFFIVKVLGHYGQLWTQNVKLIFAWLYPLIKFMRYWCVISLMGWQDQILADNVQFIQSQHIESDSHVLENRQIHLKDVQDAEMLTTKQAMILITERGSCFVYNYVEGAWTLGQVFQTSLTSRQSRRVVKSSDERCLFVSTDGGTMGSGSGEIDTLKWASDQLVVANETKIKFEGVITLGVSQMENTLLHAPQS